LATRLPNAGNEMLLVTTSEIRRQHRAVSNAAVIALMSESFQVATSADAVAPSDFASSCKNVDKVSMLLRPLTILDKRAAEGSASRNFHKAAGFGFQLRPGWFVCLSVRWLNDSKHSSDFKCQFNIPLKVSHSLCAIGLPKQGELFTTAIFLTQAQMPGDCVQGTMGLSVTALPYVPQVNDLISPITAATDTERDAHSVLERPTDKERQVEQGDIKSNQPVQTRWKPTTD
jgi:hypothetical protein